MFPCQFCCDFMYRLMHMASCLTQSSSQQVTDIITFECV